MKIVKFQNGKYGVRVSGFKYFFPKYIDLGASGYLWSRGAKYFHCCQGTLKACEAAMELRKDQWTRETWL